MKKILLSLIVIAMSMLASCDLIGKKSDSKAADGTEQAVENDTTSTETPLPPEPEKPMPDNNKGKKIVEKFNQGPAINNNDYADALEYTEIYFTLIADDLQGFKNGIVNGNDSLRKSAEINMAEVENKYPYNAQLTQILYQAAELEKTEGGLVPMNDDNRARFEALNTAYKSL